MLGPAKHEKEHFYEPPAIFPFSGSFPFSYTRSDPLRLFQKGSSEASSSFTPGETHVLVPQADGSNTIGGDPLLLDLSHTDQGYFIGTMSGDGGKINIQLIGPDNVTYKYFIEEADSPTVFPFTAGSGSYTLMAFQNISEDQYASLFSQVIDVELTNDFLPFLYPNQYVNFSQDSKAVSLAAQLTSGLTSDVEALTAIYEYVTANITYDNEKAATVSGNYLPDIDETLSTKKGICFDYASLTAAMLRSIGIPAKLAIGYSASGPPCLDRRLHPVRRLGGTGRGVQRG